MWDILIVPLEMWVENGPTETAQTQHLGHTTVIWASCTDYYVENHMMRFHHGL